MRFKLRAILASFPLHGGIAARLRKRQHHGLIEEWERLDLLDSLLCRLHAVKHDERLAPRADVLLRNDVDDGAVLREESPQRALQQGDLDGFFEIADLKRWVGRS